MAKPIWHSKTFWVNAITIAIFVLGQLAIIPEFEAWAKWLVLGVSLLNIALRAVTTQPVELPGAGQLRS